MRRFRGPVVFLGPRTSSRLGAPFWPSGLTLRSSGRLRRRLPWFVRQPTKKESTSCQNVNSAIQAVSGLVAQALTRSMSIVVWTRKNVFFVARPHMEHAVIAHLKNINMAAAQTNAFTADLHQQAHVVVAHMENMKSRSPNKRLNHVRLAHWTPASRRRLAGR